MKQKILFFSVATFYFGLCAPTAMRASEPDSLKSLLEQEAEGAIVNRRDVVSNVPADDQAGWQGGLVKVDNAWLPIEELAKRDIDLRYEAKREQFRNHADAHLILARWCVRQEMPDRARAHFTARLTTDPNNREAHEYLGHVLFGGNWVEREALEEAQQSFRQSFDQLEQWLPQVEKIVAGIHSKDSRKMTKALRELEDLDATVALHALEFFASFIDNDLAKPLIRKITDTRSEQACLALVRIALAHPHPSIQTQTARSIRTYPEHLFVPELLSMLETDKQVAGRVVQDNMGRIHLETVVSNELQNRKQMIRAQRAVDVIAQFASNQQVNLDTKTSADLSYWSNFWKVSKSAPVDAGSFEGTQTSQLANSASTMQYIPRDVSLVAAQNLFDQGKQLERDAAQENRLLHARMNKVCSLLRRTTGEAIGDDARQWWTWWNERNERYEGSKPTAFAYTKKYDSLVISSRSSHSSNTERAHDFGEMLIQYSCLVPGTLVQTSGGLVPIEQIQIGDLVLSQDVETAELTLKPVVMTTIRPPKSTILVTTGDDSIEATGGHYWWVSGRGWMKTRDLQPGMTMHTASGTSMVKSVQENPEEQRTHNLIVDGFHTYFVGKERLLSYDNTLLKPTLRTVPGYGLQANAKQ